MNIRYSKIITASALPDYRVDLWEQGNIFTNLGTASKVGSGKWEARLPDQEWHREGPVFETRGEVAEWLYQQAVAERERVAAWHAKQSKR